MLATYLHFVYIIDASTNTFFKCRFMFSFNATFVKRLFECCLTCETNLEGLKAFGKVSSLIVFKAFRDEYVPILASFLFLYVHFK